MTFLKIQWSAKNKWETKTTFVNKNYSGVQQLHLQMLCFTHLIGLIFSTVFKINYLLHFQYSVEIRFENYDNTIFLLFPTNDKTVRVRMFFYCILYYKYSEKIVINIAILLGKISFYIISDHNQILLLVQSSSTCTTSL